MTKRLLTILGIVYIFLPAFAQVQVLQHFNNNSYLPLEWNKMEEIQFCDTDSLVGFSIKMTDGNSYTIETGDSTLFTTGFSIPHIEIRTVEDLVEIPNKVDYKDATITLSGFGHHEDVTSEMQIRGRGNSTWNYAKKPYRLKFSKKISLCGLTKAKNYVLLANWNDESLMEFVVATKIAQMLDMPYTNDVIPVDVTLNGRYRGSYILTNKPGINAGSVDIDEENSVMWELDTYYDEEKKFRSVLYNLPVNLADPDMTDEQFNMWKEDFLAMEKSVYDKRADRFIDIDLFARYLLVYDLCKNDELQHPKSVKLYKTLGEGEKYKFGPIWDFDGAMSYWIDNSMLSTNHIKDRVTRCSFFKALEQTPGVAEAYVKHWLQIKPRLQEILDYIDEYASIIRNSAKRNCTLWTWMKDFDTFPEKLKEWLTLRFEAVDDFDIVMRGTEVEEPSL